MESLGITLLISMFILVSLGVCYLDTRYNLRLVDWFNGSCKNPFENGSQNNRPSAPESSADQQTIAELKERIATLEKIVTEPAYELNQKINRL